VYINFDKKTGWATFWAMFSQTRLVILLAMEGTRFQKLSSPRSRRDNIEKIGTQTMNAQRLGLPDGFFSNQKLGKFWRALDWKMLKNV
jgi:hypothetical protein